MSLDHRSRCVFGILLLAKLMFALWFLAKLLYGSATHWMMHHLMPVPL
jgi:hypothetical protein